MLKKVIFILLIALNVFAITLKETYYVDSNNINLLDVIPNMKQDFVLYEIDENRYSKRVSSRDFIKLLSKHKIDSVQASSNYINFIKKSPIDTSKMQAAILKTYKDKYPDINITSVVVVPRGYLESLPSKYIIIMPKRAHLSHKGTLAIKTPDSKKLFFNYSIDANINIYISKKKILKGDKISLLTATQKTIYFDRFKATPIGLKQLNITQAKRNMKQNRILTTRDIEGLNIIKKGSFVTVFMTNNNINISFSAKAIQNGKLNDIITVQKKDGKKFKVKVIGKNRVEMR